MHVVRWKQASLVQDVPLSLPHPLNWRNSHAAVVLLEAYGRGSVHNSRVEDKQTGAS